MTDSAPATMPGSSASRPVPDAALARARAEVDAGRPLEAWRALEAALPRDAPDARVRVALARLLEAHGEPGRALVAAEEIVRRRPDCAFAYEVVGARLLERGEALRALPYFERALGLDRGAALARQRRAEALLALGRCADVLAEPASTDDQRLRARVGSGQPPPGALASLVARLRESAATVACAYPPLRLPRRTAGAAARIGVIGCATHPAAGHLIERLAGLRSPRVELALFDFGPSPGARAGMPVNLANVGDYAAARLIADLDLDVLLDPFGTTLALRPAVLAFDLARAVASGAVILGGSDPASVPNHPAIEALARALEAIGPEGDGATWLARAESLSEALGSDGSGAWTAERLLGEAREAIRAHQRGDLAAARAAYGRILAEQPGHAAVAFLDAQAALAAGAADEADARLDEACAAAPGFRDALAARAHRLAQSGRFAEAVEAFRAVSALSPEHEPALVGLAAALAAGGESEAALSHIEAAVARRPLCAPLRVEHGGVLVRLGRRTEAVAALEAALALEPAHVAARFNLAGLYQADGDLDRAEAALRDVIRRAPGFGPAYAQLGETLLSAGRIEAWLANLDAWRAACPPSLPMAVCALEVARTRGDAAEERRWLELVLDDRLPASDRLEWLENWEKLDFLLLHFDVDRAALRRCYERYDRALAGLWSPPLPRLPAAGPRRVRVGYLSPDLRDHVMGLMILEWVRRHDASRFDVRLYATGGAQDAVTAELAAHAPIVRLDALDDRAAAARLHAEDLDVLVDCSGPVQGARPGILALRPARIAITHINAPGPIGCSAVDFKITDHFAEAPDAQDYLLETLLPMDGCVVPWRSYVLPSAAQLEAAAAERARLPPGAFVVAAFVSLLKLSPRCMDLWRALLESIPEAVLAFSPPLPALHDAYRRRALAAGIPSERVVFLPFARDETARLARYAAVDLAPDPFPYGNVNGTLEALAMGVPVVSLRGVRHGERLGYTILKNLGVEQTVAATPADYVEVARRLATDAAFLAEVRGRIAAGVARSALTDLDAHTRALEAAYLRALRLEGVLPGGD